MYKPSATTSELDEIARKVSNSYRETVSEARKTAQQLDDIIEQAVAAKVSHSENHQIEPRAIPLT